MVPNRLFRSLALLLLAAMLLVLVGAGRWWWLDTFSIVPGALWSVLALGLLFFGLVRRDWPGVLLTLPSLGLGLVWLGLVWGSEAPPSPESLRVLSWNIHGFSEDRAARLEFLRFLATHEADVLALQEAGLDDEVWNDLEAVWPDFALFNHEEWTLISRYPILEASVPPVGGFVRVLLEVAGERLELYNVHIDTANVFYGPARFERRQRQFELLREMVTPETSALVVGDFNTPWHHPFIRALRRTWTLSNPSGLSLPLSVPSLLPVARYDYLWGSPGVSFGEHRSLVHDRRLLGHLGVMGSALLP